ncbi:tail associated lysozyme [Pantoea phage Phynn]|nr:tail associated lysozyme [Pantoea phage Phynn]
MSDKVINRITSIKFYPSYEKFSDNVYLELLPALVSFSEKTTINGSSETLMQIYDTQMIYQSSEKPIIQVSFKFNQTQEQHYYGLLYSNVETDNMNRSVLRLNLSPVHKVFKRKFARSFTNSAADTITECMTTLYNDMKLITPLVEASNVRIPPSCLSGTYETVFDYIRENGQSVTSSDFCYLWEDGSGVFLKSNTEILAQTPLNAYKYNVSNQFLGDAIVFTEAEYITYKDNTASLENASFYSLSLTDKKLYSDILADTDSENSWVTVNRNAVYENNFENPDADNKPYQANKLQTLSSYEKRIKFDINQGRMDVKVGTIIEVYGDQYSGKYLIVEMVRDVSKDMHLQTIECVQVGLSSNAGNAANS